MTELAECTVLSPEEEARRLWAGATEAFEGAGSDLVSLCESLDLGIRAAEILVIGKLQSVKTEFPATIGILLDTPFAEVEPHRDAISSQQALDFTDVIDLLSAEDLACANPGLHRGWEDRRFACRRSRKTAQAAVGVSLEEEDHEQLLLLAAYRNRIFRTPPPVRILPGEILPAFSSLEKLVGALL